MELDKSVGHGSDILSPLQYHSVLAFNIYKNGSSTIQNNKIRTRVALIDLAPTILSFLHLTIPQNLDGISLMPAIINSEALTERTFFITSGMFPNQFLSKEKAIDIGTKFYRVNSVNGELELNMDHINFLNNQRIYGVIRGDWVLALYPDDKAYIPVIQNLTTGQWSDNLNSSFSSRTPAALLYQQLKTFYGKKIYLPLP
jgi:arylsulfatase A-like enzyme